MDIDAWREVVPGGTSSASPAVQHEAVSPLRNSLTISGSAVWWRWIKRWKDDAIAYNSSPCWISWPSIYFLWQTFCGEY